MKILKPKVMLDRLLDYTFQRSESILAFVSGDLLVSVIVLQLHPADALLNIIGVFVLGVVGGFAGLVGKKLFHLIENYFKNKKAK